MSNICLSNSSSLKRKRSIRRIYYYLTYFTWSENSHDNSSKLYRLGPTWDVNYICCKFNTCNSMETLVNGKNSTNLPRCKFFIAKESSSFCYWFFTPICMTFVSDSQKQCLFWNAFKLFARSIYISQVGPQKLFTSTAGCNILFTFSSGSRP